MTTAFRFAPEILRRLGEELIPNPDQGIIELVRNAYDADALECVVELKDTNRLGGSYRVTDNGTGMTPEEIAQGWLILGRSRKSPREPTPLGRIPSGDKGLGRLAALRMGDQAVLRTRPAREPGIEYEVVIDWKAFEGVEVVEDVPVTITKGKTSEGPGTTIEVRLLRHKLNRPEVKRLARALVLLADPFGEQGSFKPVLVASEYADLQERVEHGYFDDAEYGVHAILGEAGRAQLRVVDWKGAVLYEGGHEDVTSAPDKGPYRCPASTFDLWVFLLSRASFSNRRAGVGEVRSWLEAIGGVHLYHRGLRVRPYGDPGHDWLEMNLRRVRSPEERPSTNTSIGKVSVADPAEELIQKTDRAGFVENEAFSELRRFAMDSLDWTASQRLMTAEKRRQEARDVAPRDVEVARERLGERVDEVDPIQRVGVQRALARFQKAVDREMSSLREDLLLYRTLGTVGTSTATFAHEAEKPVSQIQKSAELVQRRVKKLGSETYAHVERPLDRILRSAVALRTFARVPLQLLQRDKRRVGRVDLHLVIGETVGLFEPYLHDAGVAIELELEAVEPWIVGTRAALESILANLMINSVNAFTSQEMSHAHRQIVIRTQSYTLTHLMTLADNGPGIAGLSLREIWLPGRTTYADGTGLGLTIVRDAVADLGGSVTAAERGELGGAEFTVQIPRGDSQ